jgi:hypothetical protein
MSFILAARVRTASTRVVQAWLSGLSQILTSSGTRKVGKHATLIINTLLHFSFCHTPIYYFIDMRFPSAD